MRKACVTTGGSMVTGMCSLTYQQVTYTRRSNVKKLAQIFIHWKEIRVTNFKFQSLNGGGTFDTIYYCVLFTR